MLATLNPDYDKPFLTGDTVDWRHILEINAFGLYVMTRECAE